jgi:hypothetical protein
LRIKRLGLCLGLALQLTALFALNDTPCNVNPFITTDNVFLGQQDVVVKVFRINGISSSGRIYILVKTTHSNDVPYGSDGISKVDLLPVDYNTGVGVSTPLNGQRLSDSEYLFDLPHTATASYALRYTISSTAKYSLSGGTVINTDAVLVSLRENVDDDEISVESSGSPIKINANGLVYRPESLKSMLPDNSNGVPADITFAIMQFTLRAETSEVGIKSLSLGSAENFATSTENRYYNVRRIILLADDGDGDYAGLGSETLVCDTGLLSFDKNHHTKSEIALPFNQTITLSAYSKSDNVPNTPDSEKIFYVL